MKTQLLTLIVATSSAAAAAPLTTHAMDVPAAPAEQRVYYNGPQPQITPPPAYVTDAPLPYVYCDQANQWIVLYPDRNGVQYYSLNPERRDTYKTVLRAAAQGEQAPWALRVSLNGVPTYFVNVDPEHKRTFDYIAPAAGFDVCQELHELPVVRRMLQGDSRVARGDEDN